MIAPPLPANETERLADLHALELLDTPAEERFDRIVRVAEHEIGLVDLVRVQRDLLEARAALAATQRRLARELADAAAFVRSVVPEPLAGCFPEAAYERELVTVAPGSLLYCFSDGGFEVAFT